MCGEAGSGREAELQICGAHPPVHHPLELPQWAAVHAWEGSGSGKEGEVTQVTSERAPRGGGEAGWPNQLQKESRKVLAKEMLKANTSHLLPCRKPLLLHTGLL